MVRTQGQSFGRLVCSLPSVYANIFFSTSLSVCVVAFLPTPPLFFGVIEKGRHLTKTLTNKVLLEAYIPFYYFLWQPKTALLAIKVSLAMAAVNASTKKIIWKFPQHLPTCAIMGDSQTKHLHTHYDPSSPYSPAFISQPGA